MIAAGLLLLLADLLQEGDFRRWEHGLPVGWLVEVGARNGDGSTSILRAGAEGGIALGGDARTTTWRTVSQKVATRAGTFYRLSCETRATGLRREGNQFDNAYVALLAPGLKRFEAVAEGGWVPCEMLFRGEGEATITIFLSKTGLLEVRALRLEEADPAASFDLLVRHMGRYYSYFALKGVDWEALAGRYRDRAVAAKDAHAFTQAIVPMLAELRDLHITVEEAPGTLTGTWIDTPARNYDFTAVAAALEEPRRIGRVALAGRIGGSIGYLAITSLAGEARTFAEVRSAIDGMFDCEGLLLDLRANAGGDERQALAIAALFCDQPRVYAKASLRSGPRPADLGAPVERWIRPRDGPRFLKPVVCLIGPGCVSSGEGFAKMMHALPHVTLAGQPTRGASGNPAPVDLPNGVTVHFSRWVDMLPDGTVTEGKGVAPDRPIPHEGQGDPTFVAGLELLREALAR